MTGSGGSGPSVIAVDFGATSIRVSVVDLGKRPLVPVVVHRYRHGPVRHGDGSLRWDWDRLVSEARIGLGRAAEIAAPASIGIDTWGLDYGLLDGRGDLIAPPHSYRDPRTDRWAEVADRIGRRRLYDRTGIQLMAGNTVFQLAAHDRAEVRRARHLLMLPELLVNELCGAVLAERTSAGTTALVDAKTGVWSDELIDAVGADRSWFPEIERAGLPVGRFDGVPVHLVGGHDTASAVLAMGVDPSPGTVFLSAGTWFLVGREEPQVRTDDACFAANLSNEPGVFGGVRLLANIPGIWLLEECRRMWEAASVAAILAIADRPERNGPVIDVSAPELVAPSDMPETVRALAGLPRGCAPEVIVECVVESLAVAVAGTVEQLAVSGPVSDIAAFGGAAQAEPLMARISERTGLPVRTGPAEATTLGNALAQGVALGVYADVPEARRALDSPG